MCAVNMGFNNFLQFVIRKFYKLTISPIFSPFGQQEKSPSDEGLCAPPLPQSGAEAMSSSMRLTMVSSFRAPCLR